MGGFGMLRYSVSVSAVGTSVGASDSTFGVNLGGGARFDVARNGASSPS